MSHFAAFLTIAAMVIVTPGPDTALTSLLPQFAPPQGDRFLAFVLLGLTFVTMTLIWLSAYSFLVASAGDFLRRVGIRRALEGMTGGILVALGLRLALEHE